MKEKGVVFINHCAGTTITTRYPRYQCILKVGHIHQRTVSLDVMTWRQANLWGPVSISEKISCGRISQCLDYVRLGVQLTWSDLVSKCSNRYEIWQMTRQQCCDNISFSVQLSTNTLNWNTFISIQDHRWHITVCLHNYWKPVVVINFVSQTIPEVVTATMPGPPVMTKLASRDDVIKWKHFPRNWSFVRGIHRSSDAELWCFPWSASE